MTDHADELRAGASTRSHFRSTTLRLTLAVALVAILSTAWWFRWDVHVVSRQDSSTAYIVDRITGRIYFVRGEEATLVTKDPPK